MPHKKLIGLYVLAMLAVSGTGASSASAFTGFLSEPGTQAVLAGQTTNHVFTVEGKAVECTSVKFHSKTTALISTLLEFTPSYTGCTAFGLPGSTIHVPDGCKIITKFGQMAILCPPGRHIVVLANNGSGCAVEIKPQTGLQLITFANVKGANGRMAVEIKLAITKLAVVSNGKGIGCPSTSATEGEYTGTSIAEGASGDLLVH